MKYGLYAMNYGSCAEPDNVVRIAKHAEAAGFESLWAGEHFALPDPSRTGSRWSRSCRTSMRSWR